MPDKTTTDKTTTVQNSTPMYIIISVLVDLQPQLH